MPLGASRGAAVVRVVEVNPYDYLISEVDADGYWHETNTLPLDEWRCSSCEAHIGYVTYDTAESTSMSWRQMWIPVGSDPREESTTRYCEDCAQDHQIVEED